MVEKIKNLLSQLVQEDYDALEDKRASKMELSPEAKKLDMIISKLSPEEIKSLFTSTEDDKPWYSEITIKQE